MMPPPWSTTFSRKRCQHSRSAPKQRTGTTVKTNQTSSIPTSSRENKTMEELLKDEVLLALLSLQRVEDLEDAIHTARSARPTTS